MLPDFLIIGAPKAGSTALHDALAQHPGLYLSKIKEPKFFLCEGRPPPRSTRRGPGDAHSAREWVWRRSDYERLFAGAPKGTLRGEGTPFYLWDLAAQQRIRAAVPHVKMIAVLRDPVDRAYSNWTHLWCDGLEPEANFIEACRKEPARKAGGWAPFWRYLEMGRYGEQLDHLYRLFPREQVHVLRYRELVDRPRETLDTICRFLGVEAGVLDAPPRSNVSTWVDDTPVNTALRRVITAGAALGSYAPPTVWRQASRPLLAALHREHDNRPRLSVQDRRELLGYFAEDVDLLERLTGESFADWLGDTGRGTYSVRTS